MAGRVVTSASSGQSRRNSCTDRSTPGGSSPRPSPSTASCGSSRVLSVEAGGRRRSTDATPRVSDQVSSESSSGPTPRHRISVPASGRNCRADTTRSGWSSPTGSGTSGAWSGLPSSSASPSPPWPASRVVPLSSPSATPAGSEGRRMALPREVRHTAYASPKAVTRTECPDAIATTSDVPVPGTASGRASGRASRQRWRTARGIAACVESRSRLVAPNMVIAAAIPTRTARAASSLACEG